jgi:hypothetical protein
MSTPSSDRRPDRQSRRPSARDRFILTDPTGILIDGLTPSEFLERERRRQQAEAEGTADAPVVIDVDPRPRA